MKKYVSILCTFLLMGLMLLLPCTTLANSAATVDISTSSETAISQGFSGLNNNFYESGMMYTGKDIKDAAVYLKPGWLRYDGGTAMDAFNWTTGTIQDEFTAQFFRKPWHYNQAYTYKAYVDGKLGKNRLSEFKKLTDSVDAKVVVIVNGLSDSAQSAGDLARFCKVNNIKVLYYELCNEAFYYTKYPSLFKNGTDFADKMKPYYDAIKGADPNAKCALMVSQGDRQAWDGDLRNYSNKYWDAVSVHTYQGGYSSTSMDDSVKMLNAHLNNVSTWIDNIAAYQCVPAKQEIIVTEYNASLDVPSMNTLYDGIYVAELVNRFAAKPAVKYAGMHELNDFASAMTNKHTEVLAAGTLGTPLDTSSMNFGIYYRAPGLALKVVNEAVNNSSKIWGTTVTGGDSVTATGGSMPALQAQAYKGDNGKNYVVITNKSANDHDVTIKMDNANVTAAMTKTSLSAAVPDAADIRKTKNTSAAPNNITINGSSTANPVTVSAYSVVRVEWSAAGRAPEKTFVEGAVVRGGDGISYNVDVLWKNAPGAADYTMKYGTASGNYSGGSKTVKAPIHEDFNDGTPDGWNTNSGSWSIIGTAPSCEYKASASSGHNRIIRWMPSGETNYTVQAKIKTASWTGSVGLDARVSGDQLTYYNMFYDGSNLQIRKSVNGTMTNLGAAVPLSVASDPNSGGIYHTYSLNTVTEAGGNVRISVFVDGLYKASYNDTASPITTSSGIGCYSYNQVACFDDIDTAYTITGLSKGANPQQMYYFTVESSNTGGSAGNGNEVAAVVGKLYTPTLRPPAFIGDGSVQLSWTATTSAAGYMVRYGTARYQYTADIDAGNTCGLTITGLNNNTPYYFVVYAYNNAMQSSDYSGDVTATPKADMPYAPNNLSVLSAPTAATLTWDPSYAEDFKDNFNDGDDSGWTQQAGTWAVDANTKTYKNTSTGQKSVSVYSNGDTNSWKDYVVEMRINPLSAAFTGKVGIVARVQDSSNYYRAYFDGNDDTCKLEKVTNGTATVLHSVPYNYQYSSQIIRFEVCGNILRVRDGTVLVAEKVDTDSPILQGPFGCYAENKASATQQAFFDDICVRRDKAAYYRVQRSTSPQGTYTDCAASVSARSYGDSGLDGNTTYYYRVSAINANGESGFSNVGTKIPCKFEEDFEDGDAAGWTPSGGTWGVVSGEGRYAYYCQQQLASISASVCNSIWPGDYTVEAGIKAASWTGTVALMGRVTDINNHYRIAYDCVSQQLAIRKVVGGTATVLNTSTAFYLAPNTYHTFKFVMSGSTLIAYVNGVERARATDTTFAGGGKAGCMTYNQIAAFDDILVR